MRFCDSSNFIDIRKHQIGGQFMNAGLVVFQHRQFRLKHLKKWKKKMMKGGSLCSRRLMGSTDQADPSCFHFSIIWILMEHRCFYFFCPLGFLQGLRSLKHWLLQNLSIPLKMMTLLAARRLGVLSSYDMILFNLMNLKSLQMSLEHWVIGTWGWLSGWTAVHSCCWLA